MKVVLTPDAENDLRVASQWLADRSEELPRKFEIAVSDSLASIAERPEMYPIVRTPIRRVLLHTFPYGVFYLEDEELIVVIGVVHNARDPRIWEQRAKKRH